MADNTELNAGSGGDTIGSDDIGGVKYQRVKIIVGADGTNDGDVADGNPLPIDDAGGSLTIDGTVTANLSATDNAVLDAIAADGDAIQITLGTIDTDTGNIATAASAIQTAVELIDNAISGSEMQVDVVAALPAGTNAIGKLAANSGVDIGDVDVLSHPSDTFVAEAGSLGKGVLLQGDDGTDRKNVNVDATTGDVQVDVTNTVTVASHAVTNAGTFATQVDGDALTALQLIDDAVHVDDAAFTLGTSKGVMAMGFAGTQSVDANDAAALACDSDGALHISDGGNTITVDGTVTANAGTNLNTSALALESGGNLADIETNTDFGATTGNGTAAGALRVTVASDTTGVLSVDDNGGALTVDNGGTFAVQNTAQPSIATGCTSYYDSDLDETAVAADTGAVGIYAITAFNTTAAPLFLQLFNVAQGSVTVGTTTPTNQFVVPGNADSDGAGFTVSFPMPLIYGTALTVACSTNSEGNSAPGAGACIVNIIHST